MSSVQTVVIDQDGERGVITAFDPQEPTVQVEHEGQTFLVPTDLLTALGQSYFSLPTASGPWRDTRRWKSSRRLSFPSLPNPWR